MQASVRPDINYLSLSDKDVSQPIENLDLLDVNGRAYASVLKCSHKQEVIIVGAKIPAGIENAADFDDIQDFDIDGEFGSSDWTGDQVVTIKGGCRDGYISGTVYGPPGRQNSHVQIGNWFDQNYAMTQEIVVHLRHGIGGKVNVVTGWVVPFSIHLGPQCRWLFWESVKLKAYIVAKFAVRFVLRIKKGEKGPSWM